MMLMLLTETVKNCEQRNGKRVVTSAGDKEISEPEEKNSGGDFVIEGKGYGHGVGMSQWGAKNGGGRI